MSSFCFTQTRKHLSAAKKIASLSSKEYTPMSVLSTLYPYILREYARVNKVDIANVDEDDLFDGLNEDWEYGWKEFCTPYMKAIDNFKRVDFDNVRRIVQYRLVDNDSYIKLLEKYNLYDNNITDAKGNEMLYEDLKMQLLAKIINKNISKEDANNIGYRKIEHNIEHNNDEATELLVLEDGEPTVQQQEEETLFTLNFADKPLILQANDIKFQMSAKERLDAVNRIAHGFMNYIDKYVSEFEGKVKQYASDKNVSILRAKWEISRNNDNLRRRIKKEQSVKNPQIEYINKWRSQIIPLNEEELIKLYTAKAIAQKLYQWFLSKPEFSTIAENFDSLFIEAASIVNKVYNINLLGNIEIYDNFTEGENIEDPSESNMNEDAPKADYSHADDKTKASEASLTKKVKRAYTKCFNIDSNGNKVPVNISAAHNKVLHLTQGMIDKDDLIPMLSKSNEPWVKQFIEMLKKDENLFKQLYRCIKLSSQDYRIIYYDKRFKTWKQKSINMDDMSNLIMKETVVNVENGLIQGDKGLSLYDDRGNINKGNIQTLVNFIKETRKEIDVNNLELIESEIKEILRDLGITMPISFDFIESVSVRSNTDEDKFNVVNEFFGKCLNITDAASKAVRNKDIPIQLRVDDNSSYKWLYGFISNSAIGYVESVTNEQGKSYYTYTKTNYFDELILKIKRSVPGKISKNNNDYYQEFLDNQFKCSEFFYDSRNKSWRSDWMSKLFDNSPLGNIYRKIFQRSNLLYTDNVEYLDWDRQTAIRSSFLMYRQGEDFALPVVGEKAAWYRMPIASDSPAGDYIRFISYVGDGYEDKIYDKLWDVCKQELVRMNDVSEHLKKSRNGESTSDSIKSYDAVFKDDKLIDAGGLIFTLLPQLNYIKINTEDFKIFSKTPDIIGSDINFVDIIKHLDNKKNDYGLTNDDLKNFFKEVYKNWSDKDISKEYDEYIESIVGTVLPNETVENRFNAWKNYSLNTQLAFTQIVELTSTDLAFFGKRKVVQTSKENSNFKYNGKYYKIESDDALDVFQKRNKEYHAPTNKIATDKEFYREVYLDDIKIKSQILENVEHIIMDNKFLSSQEKINIISMYKKSVNVADGQAYRSLTSYKEMLKDFGELDPEVEKAFDRIIKTHQWDLGDLSLITLAIKPYMYSVIPIDRDTERLDGSQNKVPTPTQHKNSEYPILAALGAISLELQESIPLRALSEFMDKNKIDVIQFNSAVKVGEVGTAKIDWNSTDAKSIIESLEKYCGFDISEDGISTRVHKISTGDWGEQQKKPEHLIDKQQLVGSQPRRLVLADIPDVDKNGNTYTIKISSREKPYTKQEFIEHYQELISQNILEDYRKVDKIFEDPKKLSEFLREQVSSSSKYDTDLLDMFTWDQEKGRFNIPFWDQSIANRVEELLNGLIRNRISKQKMRGGAAVQTADVGMTKKLNVRYQDENGNIKDTFDEFIDKHPDKTKNDYEVYLGDARLAYMECMLPMWSKDIMEALTSDNGIVDFNRLPEELREIIGYRIPTEDHYSMAPLKVVGFMPTMGASSIMLPADITKIAGSDFDVDVMYLLIKEFYVQKIDVKSAKDKYNYEVSPSAKLGKVAIDKLLGDIFNTDINGIVSELSEDEEKFGIWLNRHEEEFYLPKDKWKIIPIKYDTSKTEKQNSRKARNNEIIDCMYACLTSEHSIEKFSNPGNYEPQKNASRVCECLKLRKDKSPKTILDASTEQLEEWIAQAKSSKNIGSPVTAVELHQQNAVGVALKGIFAAANAIQQLFEYAPVQNNMHFVINWNNSNRGEGQWILGRLRDRNGNLITKRLAGYLAAAVDNGKDPIMGPLLIDKTTANVVVYLTLLGYNPLEIALLMNCAQYSTESGEFSTLHKEEIEEYKLNREESALDIEQMAWAIQNPATVKGIAIRKHAKDMLENISIASGLLGSFTQLMRADSIQSNVGKSMFDNIMFTVKYMKAVQRNDKLGIFSKVGEINTNPEWPMLPFSMSKIDNIESHVKDSKIPYLQTFIDTTIRASYDWIGPYSLLTNDAIFDRVYNLASNNGYLNEKLVKKYLSDLECWSLNQTELFGKDNDNTLSEKKIYYAKQFPQEFQKFKKNLPEELKNNVFIDNVIVVSPNKEDKFIHLEVKDLGLSKSIRDQFKSDFIQLAQVNPEMAMKLFVYTVYRDGLGYSQTGFSHLIPSVFKRSLPGYIDNLYRLKDIENDDNFFEQFVRNNYKVFYDLAPDRTPIDKESEKEFNGRLIVDSTGYNYTIGYISVYNFKTKNRDLYKMVVDSPNIYDDDVKTSYRLVKLNPLGMGKHYHDYDINGGIKILDVDVNYDDIDQEYDPNKEEWLPDEAFEKVKTTSESTEQKSDKPSLKESTNRTDDSGMKQC